MKDVALNKRSINIVSHLPSEHNNKATTPNAIPNQMPTAPSPRPWLIQMPSASPQCMRSIVFTNQAPPATSNPTGTSNNTIASPRSNAAPVQMPLAISNPTGTSNITVAGPMPNPAGPTGASNTTVVGPRSQTGTSNTCSSGT
jgi:hypothetical protein